MLFYIAERLHMSIRQVEQMSVSEVRGWIDWFAEGSRPADDAIDLHSLSKEQLKAMFHK